MAIQVEESLGSGDLDAVEAFDKIQMERIATTDPDSAAFHVARKKVQHLSAARMSSGTPVATMKHKM